MLSCVRWRVTRCRQLLAFGRRCTCWRQRMCRYVSKCQQLPDRQFSLYSDCGFLAFSGHRWPVKQAAVDFTLDSRDVCGHLQTDMSGRQWHGLVSVSLVWTRSRQKVLHDFLGTCWWLYYEPVVTVTTVLSEDGFYVYILLLSPWDGRKCWVSQHIMLKFNGEQEEISLFIIVRIELF